MRGANFRFKHVVKKRAISSTKFIYRKFEMDKKKCNKNGKRNTEPVEKISLVPA